MAHFNPVETRTGWVHQSSKRKYNQLLISFTVTHCVVQRQTDFIDTVLWQTPQSPRSYMYQQYYTCRQRRRRRKRKMKLTWTRIEHSKKKIHLYFLQAFNKIISFIFVVCFFFIMLYASHIHGACVRCLSYLHSSLIFSSHVAISTSLLVDILCGAYKTNRRDFLVTTRF